MYIKNSKGPRTTIIWFIKENLVWLLIAAVTELLNRNYHQLN